MYQSLSINHLRGIRELTLKPLQRISLITGRNGCGKTTILEAMFLIVGHHNPQIPFSVGGWRGMLEESAEETVSWLFGSKETAAPIEISVEREGISFALSVTFLSPEQMKDEKIYLVDPVSGEQSTTEIGQVPGIKMILKKGDVALSESGLILLRDGPAIGASAPQLGYASFINAFTTTTKDNPKRFSRCRERGQVEKIIESLQIIEKRLTNLVIHVSTSGKTGIYADVQGSLIPMPLLGQGASRLLSIVLAIFDAENGVVLVDEIENGFHHSAIEKIWEAIDAASKGANVQVMATTHSLECIDAAHRHFEKSGNYDFGLHRLDASNGLIKDVVYREEILEAAISGGIEVR